MIVEDEYDLNYEIRSDENEFEYDDFDGNIIRSNQYEMTVTNVPDTPGPLATIITRIGELHDKQHHRQLRDDLRHHLYENFPLYKKT